MRTGVRFISFAAVILAAVIICWSTYAQRPAAPRTVWEYRSVSGASDADLNSLGAQGWELVAVSGGENTSARYYLKRAR